MPTFTDHTPTAIGPFDTDFPSYSSSPNNAVSFNMPPLLAHVTDGNVNSFAMAGRTGVSNFGPGRVKLLFGSHAALGSGQILDGVAFHGIVSAGQMRVVRGASHTFVPNPAWDFVGNVTGAFVGPPGIAQDGTTSWTLANFDDLEFWWEGNGLVNTTQYIYEAKARSRVYNRPTLTIATPVEGSTIVTTTKPNVSWAFSGDGLAQHSFRVRVFSAAQYGIGGFDPATSPATYDSGIVVSVSPSHTILQPLANGTTYRVYVVASQKTPASNYVHWSYYQTTWSTFKNFTVNLANPAAPDMYHPDGYTQITTDIPLLKAYSSGSAVAGAMLGAEFQLATDLAFTQNVRGPFRTPESGAVPTFIRPSGAHILSELVSYQIPPGASTELFVPPSMLWYIRVRGYDFTNGLTGAWNSQPVSFNIYHAPSAAAIAPKDAQHVPWVPSGANGLVTLSWSFSDPSPVDFQSKYQVFVYSGPTLIFDSGLVTSTVQECVATIPAAYKDLQLQWYALVYDSDALPGHQGTTAWATFRTRDIPVANVTTPTATVTTPTTPVAWTFTGTGGRTQQAWAVEIYEGAVLPENVKHVASGIGTVLSYDFTGLFQYEYGKTYNVKVTLTDSGNLSGSDIQTTVADWDAPPKPTELVVTTLYDAAGYVQVSWTNAVQDGEYAGYRVYRRNGPTLPWTLLGEVTNVATSYTFNDYGAPSNTAVDYAVVQLARRFGTVIESDYLPAVSATPTGNHYWLLHPVDPTLSIVLSNVTSESFSNEYEKATLAVIGRGRRVERGTNYGYKGTLTCDLRDDPPGGMTAREKRIAVEDMKHLTEHVFLRNPFGDVWQVSLDDISFSRVPGLGLREDVSMTIPYEEVG